MKRVSILTVAACLLVPLVPSWAEQPSQERLEADTRMLADDQLGGRETGSVGYDLAAGYVAGQFAAIGLKPFNGATYFQDVPLRTYERDPDGINAMSLVLPSGGEVAIDPAHVMIGAETAAEHSSVEAPLVFVGNGFSDRTGTWDDFRNVDLRGKIAVVVRSTPKGVSSDESGYYRETQAERIAQHGAVGMIVLVTPTYEKIVPWDTLKSFFEPRSNMTWVDAKGEGFSPLPQGFIRAFADEATGRVLMQGQPVNWDAVAAAEADGTKPLPTFEMGFGARITATNKVWDTSSPNVLGVLPGSDPKLANEVVVLSAHLDGIGTHETPEEGDDEIVNAAMDNAIGVAAITEIARLLVHNPPRRTVLFAAFTGEEQSLIGSNYLARNPVMADTHKVVADVNIDMPLSTFPFTELVAFGIERTTLAPVVAAAAAKSGVALVPDPQPEQGYFTRSDHYEFVTQGIPSFFTLPGFANGGKDAFETFQDKHYHEPSDEIRYVDFTQLARHTTIHRDIVEGIANMDKAPVWRKGDFFGTMFKGPMED